MPGECRPVDLDVGGDGRDLVVAVVEQRVGVAVESILVKRREALAWSCSCHVVVPVTRGHGQMTKCPNVQMWAKR